MITSRTIMRKTGETDVCVTLSVNGSGKSNIKTGVGFLDHMLTLFAKHSRMDLDVTCKGDFEVDYHHSVEDIGICLGKAFAAAVGDCKGICRYGSMILPMDEALVMTAVDVSGRDCLVYDLNIPTEKVGDFDTELVQEFMIAFTRNAGISLHVKQLAGINSHHIIEGAFKSLARALRAAVSIDLRKVDEIPSTKGKLL